MFSANLVEYKNKRVLITGGLGFIGSNLAIDLVRLGARVTIVDALIPLGGGNEFNVKPIRDEIQVSISDIRDAERMAEAVREKDIIFNLAAQTSHIDSLTDPFYDLDINCRGTLVFLETCRKLNPEGRIVYAGTRAQYGKCATLPVHEKSLLNPTDIYGANRHTAEQYHFIYSRLYGLRVTSLRVNNTYGPRHQMKHPKFGVLNWFVRLAIDNEEIPIFGDGLQLRDYNYVTDVVQAFLLAGLSEAACGEVFNLGSDRPSPLVDFVRSIIKVVGRGRNVHKPWPTERQKIEIGDYIADISKAKALLKWSPQVPFEMGLEETARFYRQYRGYYW